MSGLNLMVDIDEVIFPLGDSVHAIGHEFGLHDNSMPWSMWEAWKQYGCEEDAYWDLWRVFAARDGYRTTPPIPGTVEALRRLYFAGHTINLVTARGFFNNGVDVRRWTADWLEEFAVPHHTLTFSRNKALTQRELGDFDLAIDDSPRNYLDLDNAGVDVRLQKHPHNALFWRTNGDVSVIDNVETWARVVEQQAAMRAIV